VTRAVIYLRVSTAKQAEKDLTEEGYSIPAQREACVRHVRDQGWTLVDEYPDRGESARSADRPQLQAMLARIAEDRLDSVDAHIQQWQTIPATAARFATDCARTYIRADEPTRRLLNAAVINASTSSTARSPASTGTRRSTACSSGLSWNTAIRWTQLHHIRTSLTCGNAS